MYTSCRPSPWKPPVRNSPLSSWVCHQVTEYPVEESELSQIRQPLEEGTSVPERSHGVTRRPAQPTLAALWGRNKTLKFSKCPGRDGEFRYKTTRGSWTPETQVSHTGGGHGKTSQAGEQESELLFKDPSPGQGGSRDRWTLITESSSSDGLTVLCLKN